jgi:SNF2 family DNA or RNA helicase
MLGRSAGLKSLTTASDAPQDDGERDRQLDALRRGLAPFILRRTKDQVLTELPKKTEQTLHIDLLPADRKRYDELRRHYRESLLKKVADQGMNRARMHAIISEDRRILSGLTADDLQMLLS